MLATETLDAIRYYVASNPKTGRYTLMEQFDLREHEAREALQEIRNEKPKLVEMLRIAAFDLETTSLKGDLGRLLVGSIYSYPAGTITTFRQDQMPRKSMADDRAMAVAIRDCLETHHMLVGWHSKGFDVPFLNTRLVQNGERRLVSMLHVDPMYAYRGWHGIKPRSSRLSTVAEFYNLAERKMDVDIEVWVRAQGGDTEAMDILSERCESDVRLLAEITARTFDQGLVKNIGRYA